MKVYVCYKAWAYEGCSEPLAVFKDEEKAKAWVKENSSDASDYETLEVVE